MLEATEISVPAWFVIFIVFPLVSYFLLGKWNESARRKHQLSLLAEGAAVETLQVDNRAVRSITPAAHKPNSVIHQCARCFHPAKTRCSQCKAVWYCSGRCQIVHWRHVHKFECLQFGKGYESSSPMPKLCDASDRMLAYDEPAEHPFKYNVQQTCGDGASSEDIVYPTLNTLPSAAMCTLPGASGGSFVDRRSTEMSTLLNGSSDLSRTAEGNVFLYEEDFTQPIFSKLLDDACCHESRNQQGDSCAPTKAIGSTHENDAHIESMNVQAAGGSRVSRINGNSPGLKISENNDRQRLSVDSANRQSRMKMIFSYSEFVKYFQFEIFGVAPRGLVNCGNSCYANAALQCLMFTRPLATYLLNQSHSRAGCTKDWCLMCELEHLALMLRESGGPLSPMNILMYIRSLNSQIGDGSPEDAHEFLRLLVASMQSICLESFRGENTIDPRLHDTTFIQHTFGGWLRSKVTCLRCNHESERHERMMDLTLEIYGRVESLEDALTRFTGSENLDGDNMYRCLRCAVHVPARKQLNIQVAPNILTIVLKRFQGGNYGKIDKYVTFPEMLDMVPFMTGTDDIPTLYLLYAIVVHVDTPNATFSGHYISYVKDLQGNWLRVDDTEVKPVGVNQVMSEEAYILFYMRSHPRPTRGNVRATRQRIPGLPTPRQSPSIIHRPSRPEQGTENYSNRAHEPCPNHRLETHVTRTNISTGILIQENRAHPLTLRNYTEFSDAGDWSLFTNSDDSSFTTDSARDSFSSFSTVDHADAFSSIFHNSLYPTVTDKGTILCSMFPNSVPRTRFIREERGFVSAGLEFGENVN